MSLIKKASLVKLNKRALKKYPIYQYRDAIGLVLGCSDKTRIIVMWEDLSTDIISRTLLEVL